MFKRLLVFTLLLGMTTWLGAQLPPPCPSNAFPPADLCSDACIYCNFNGISSTTAGYTSQTPPGFCGTIENEQWLGFIAGAGSATFTATATNCTNGDGIQVALYEACGSTPLACYGGCGNCQGTPASITSGLVIGQNYFFMIDGFAGDQCSFNISVNPPQAVAAPPIGGGGAIQGPTEICPGAENVVYTIPPINGAAVYTWNAPAGSTINGQSPPVEINATDGGNQVTVTFGSAGGQICVRAANSCYTGGQICKNIIVKPIPPTTLPPATICFEDIPFTTAWGQDVSASGLYTVTLDSWLGCDSVVRQQVTVKPPIIKQNPPQTICIGEMITVCGQEITEQGPYSVTCQSYQGCDSLVTGLLQVFNPLADILNTGTITCNTPSVTLVSGPTQGIKIWKNAAGQTIGSGNTLTVNAGGMYILQVTAMSGTVSCTTTDTVVVTANNALPNSTAVGGTIGCGNNNLTLNGGSTTSGVTFSWGGPNGFTSGAEDPVVNAPGSYVLTVTNPANGCTSSATAVVDGNTTAPSATTTGNTLTCAATTVSIGVTSNAPTATFVWNGPNNFNSAAASPTVTTPGNYTVTVTNPVNNCTSTATAVVSQNITPPNSTASGGVISCVTPNITLNGGSTTPGATFSWAGPNGFSSTLEDPTAGTAGTYTLTVQGTNGCTSTATTSLTGNTIAPNVSAAGGTLTCAVTSISLNGGSTTPGATFSWSNPSGFNSAQEDPSVTSVGTYTLTVTGPNQCTSTATATVDGNFAQPNASATGGTITCQATSVVINGNSTTTGVNYSWSGPGNFSSTAQNPTVTNTGTYTTTVTGPNGCTNTATAEVVPDANIPNAAANGGTITCLVSQIQLSGSSTTPGTNLSWRDPAGNPIAGQAPTVSTPGTYTLTVNNPSTGCSAIATAIVNEDKVPPAVDVEDGMITCSSPNFVINSTTAVQGVTYSWTGPNGFTSTDADPTVSAAGNYILTATGTNGCPSTTTAVVTADQNIPVPQATGGTLTCAVNSINLTSDANLVSTYAWSGPSGFTSPLQNPVATLPGDYVVTVTSGNGCTATITAVVSEDRTAPGATTADDVIDCNNATATLVSNSQTSGVNYAWIGPGSFSSNDKDAVVSTPGTYTVFVTGANGCTSTQTAEAIADLEAPIVAGVSPDILTCARTTVTIDGTITTNTSPLQTISWTGPSFTSDVEDPAVVNPGPYTMTATSANGCSAQVTVTVNQDIAQPNVSALGATLTCVVTQVPLSGGSTTAGATFLWTGPGGVTIAEEDPTVTVAGQYTLEVTAPNGCKNSQTVEVELDGDFPNAAASASLTTLTCKDLTTTLTGTSTTPGVAYAWSGPNAFSSSSAIVPNIAVPGDYLLAVTAQNGCVTNQNVTILQDIAAPGAVAVGDTIDCITGQAPIVGSSQTTGTTYNWIGPGGFASTNASNIVTIDGVYALTVTGPNGCTSTAEAVVERNTDSPDITLFGGGLLTCIDLQVPIVASLGTAGTTGVWTGPNGFSSTLDTIAATQPGTYQYEGTAPNGCKTTVAMQIPQNIVPPAFTSTPNILLNCTQPNADITTTNVPTWAYAWVFQGNLFSFMASPNVDTAGVYSLTVTDVGNGCSATSTTVVTEDKAAPDIAVTAPIITCAAPTIVLDAETAAPSPAFSWSLDGDPAFSTEEDPAVSLPGDYRVTVTNTVNGCTSTFDYQLIENTTAPGATAAGIVLTCTSPTGTITSNSPTTGVTYRWEGPGGFSSTNQNPTVTETGTYTVTITNTVNGCTSTANAEVEPDASLPQLEALGGTITCKDPSVQLQGQNLSNNPTYTWLWTGPGGFSSIEQNPVVSVPGNYTAVLTNPSNGCKSSKTATVGANIAGPVVSTSTPDKLTCTVTQVTLNANVSAPGSYLYDWSTANGIIVSGANSQNPTVSQAGVYTVIVTDQGNGCTSDENVDVEIDPATPSGAQTNIRDVSCFGDTDGAILVSQVEGGTPPFLYSLDNQPFTSSPNFTFLPPGEHELTIQDANGCEYSTVYEIDEPEELQVYLGPDTTLHLGQSINLNLDNAVNDPSRIFNIQVTPSWMDTVLCDSCEHELLPLYTINYKVTVLDSNGCKATDSRLVIVDKTRYVYIPNVIDPNSNENNIFTVFGGEGTVQVKALKIFDRWGESVHEVFNFPPNDLTAGWRGEYRDKEGHSGVFVYYAEVLFLDGEIKVYKGDVAVIRN